jgi:RimJ/RimL family protein N-acetyltransferase
MAGQGVVETDRLVLREFREDDVEAYYALGSDPAVVRYTGTGQLQSLEQALQVLRERPLADYRKHGFGRWACILKATGAVIGMAGLKWLDELGEVDVVYWLLPAYWGCGLATEAAQASLNHGFQHLRLQRIIGLVNPANARSQRVIEKLGMTRVGIIEYFGAPAVKFVIEAKAPTQPGGAGA